MKLFTFFAPLLFVATTTGCNPTPSSAEEVVRAQGDHCPLAFKTSNLCAQLDWIIHPSDSSDSSFYLIFFADDDPTKSIVVPEADLEVELWMPSMGHGSAPVEITKESSGRFKVTRAYFIMPGDWEIIIRLRSENKIIDEQAYSFDL